MSQTSSPDRGRRSRVGPAGPTGAAGSPGYMSPVVVVYLIFTSAVVVAFIVLALIFIVKVETAEKTLNSVATAEHVSAVKACNQANKDRMHDSAAWRVILKLPKTATAPQRAEAAHVAHLIAVKDALRDCAVLYSTAPKN